MPLGAARITLLAFSPSVEVEATVIRRKVGISAVGNAQIDTAQSKFGGASALFDGTGDRLTVNEPTDLGSGEFTIETWIRPATLGILQVIYDDRPASGAGGSNILIYLNGTNLYYYSTGNHIAGTIGSTNTWYHVAVSRDSSNDVRMFVNGTQVGSTYSDTNTKQCTDNEFYIGQNHQSSANYWNGHLDEVRVSNTARYTSGFTPSTTPFVNDINTLLLLHMDGTDGSTFFEDDNGLFSSASTRTANTITAHGDAQVDTAQSKFGGSSALFDGNNDAILVYNNNDSFSYGTGDFTIEAWVRWSSVSNTRILDSRQNSISNRTILFDYSGGNIRYYTTGGVRISASLTPTTGVWYHLALCRDSGVSRIFINGTQGGSDYNDTTDIDAYTTDIGSTFCLFAGANSNGTTVGNSLNGHADEVRISNSARYTSNFTPSTTPFTNDDNTLLLVHMDGADASTDFEDDTVSKTGRSAVGFSAYNNAEISTDNSKFGGSSMYSTGGTQMALADYIEANFDHGIGTGDFTVEWWNKWETSGATNMFSLTDSSLNVGFEMRLDNAANWRFYKHESSGSTFSAILTSNNEIYAYQGNWNHFAWVRESGTVYLYVNGTKSSVSASYTTDLANATIMHIGSGIKSGYPSMNGYMDEVRVSNTARYTASFTAPSAPFLNDTNTLALLHMNGTDTTTVFRDDNGEVRNEVGVTAHGNAQLDTAQSKFGGASLQLDGNDDYLVIQGVDGSFNDEWVNGSEWTVEYWVRGTSFSGFETHFGDWGSAADRSFFLGSDTGGDIMFFYTDSGGTLDTAIRANSVMSTNTWHHIALVKDATNFTLYVDGSSVDSGASENLRAQGNPTRIGASATNLEDFLGYIDEVRVSNTARYTGTFTAPTEQFQNDANTLLLLHMDGTDTSTTIIDDNGKIEPGLTYSGDSYAGSVKLAVPFDSIHEMDDVSHSLIGSTSTQATLTDGAASSLSTTQVKWTSPSYTKSYLGDIGLGSANTYALSTSIPASGSGTFVIEGWFLASSSTSNANWCISSGESGGRFLFGINSSSSINYAAENNIGLGDSNWHHVAIVCDAGSKRVYIDGVYKQATTGGNTDWYSTNTGFSTLHVGQFNSGDGNDYRGHIQDLKVTIGSIRGYTGTSTSSANFALPRPIVLQYA